MSQGIVSTHVTLKDRHGHYLVPMRVELRSDSIEVFPDFTPEGEPVLAVRIELWGDALQAWIWDGKAAADESEPVQVVLTRHPELIGGIKEAEGG